MSKNVLSRLGVRRKVALVLFVALAGVHGLAVAQESMPSRIQHQLSMLERDAQGRLGVVLIDTADNSRLSYRADERFPFCSTSKVMAVGALLKASEQQHDLLSQTVEIRQSDLVNYNPVTAKHVGSRMRLDALAAATLQYSDNTAMNLLVGRLGGTSAVTRFSRSIGDEIFRLDRLEPELNSAIPGDMRDTTTPTAMAESLRKLTLGDALQPPQRARLVSWMKGNTTGDRSIRAGLPANWEVADKTGGGDYGTTNDIAVIWPTGRPPLILVVYFTRTEAKAATRPDVLARATHIVTQQYQ